MMTLSYLHLLPRLHLPTRPQFRSCLKWRMLSACSVSPRNLPRSSNKYTESTSTSLLKQWTYLKRISLISKKKQKMRRKRRWAWPPRRKLQTSATEIEWEVACRGRLALVRNKIHISSRSESQTTRTHARNHRKRVLSRENASQSQ